MSNVSVILCVPRLIKDNCYSIIDTVTEPMQCNNSTPVLVVNTNKIGAYERVENESQRLSVKMVEDNIYNIEFVDSIQQNQMKGEAPDYCIPLTINAITVQGISYSDPYFSSFNLKYNKMAEEKTPENMNKSDYAFNSSVYIIRDENSTDKIPLNGKSETVSQEGGRGESASSFDAMVELARRGEELARSLRARGPAHVDSWGNPRCLRLCGGGESSLNAASGWGSPPGANNNAGNWSAGGNSSAQANNGGTNAQQQWNNAAQRPPTSQPDNAINPANGNPGSNSPGSASGANGPAAVNGTGTTSSAKIEQLNSMREALFSQDGWGGQHVNQDTNWDVPGSPEPGVKVEPGAPAGPPVWKTSSSNGAFLGTDLWEANLRNGGQPPPQPAAKTPWGHTPTTNIGGTWGEDDDAAEANVWTGPPAAAPYGPPQHAAQWRAPKKDDWNAWGEPPRPNDLHMEHRGETRAPPMDPRLDLRGGISGRLNDAMWTQHHQHAAGPAKMMPAAAAAVNQWGAQGPKDMKAGGWEEPSPPAARRGGAFDEGGTSLWGANRGGAARGGPARMPPGKPDAVWGGPRNGAWEEPHAAAAAAAAGAWPDRDAAWPDAAPSWPKHKPGPPAWPDDIGEWPGQPKPPQGSIGKSIPKEMVWNSKQFRFLVDMGYKKEEVEAALRARDMNAEEALELLAAAREGWRRDEMPPPFPPPNKMLPHHHHAPPYNPNSGTANSGQPSTAQLRMLVQQIQMAVSAGYLNHQILNQPLAPQTLVLLNQLLQQIKVLQTLVQQHTMAMSKANSTLTLQLSMQITKAKQQISALQNQIATQQALYMKQQPGAADPYKQNHDPLSQLQNNFGEMAIAKEPPAAYGGGGGNQQSRLTQWKLPALDKDAEGSEFSRAPGTAKSATSPQLNQLGLQPDSTWGVAREGWGDSADVADGKDAWPAHPQHQPVYDLVPEFEPGKPWKGNQMKSVEDDPAMTPGSVGRPSLSLTAIKDTDMLAGKTSPPAGGERSLSSSTWTYDPRAATPAALKPGTADAWNAKGRSQPPPGLKGWPQHPNASQQRAVPSWQASTWLLLKNLTAQIDGSTLKTLCVQHGPLQNFHLYLNQGIALARYSTREEAAKAQMALNNCVLSNTTIFAESPGESDVQMILQHLGSGGGGAWRGKDWPGFLWPEQHEARATPSSLNSFLPPDLLGGESI